MLVDGRGDAKAQQHALRTFEQSEVVLREPHGNALELRALHAAIRIEQSAQEAAVEVARRALDLGRDRRAVRTHAELAREVGDRVHAEPELTAAGHFLPARVIRAVVEAARRMQRRGHHRMRTADIHVAVAHRRARPHREHRAFFGDPAIADEQAHEIALALSTRAPSHERRRAVILQQHAIARDQIARRAPLRRQAPARERRDAAHAMISREAQRMAFVGHHADDGLGRGPEESFRRARMILAIDARRERAADELRHLARTFVRLHPGIRRDAGVRGADVLAPPVVVHLIDAVDEDEAGLGEIVGGRHDHVPHAPRRQRLVDLAADEAVFARDVALGHWPFAPDELRLVVELVLGWIVFLGQQREGEIPVLVRAHRGHEFVGDEQRQVELAQSAVLALGADEFQRVRMTDIEGAHLRTAAAAGRRHGETHLVVDIHERQRPRGVGAGARHVRAARTQRREFVADAAVVNDGETVVPREIVVVLLDVEIEKRLRQRQVAFDRVHRPQAHRKADDAFQRRETHRPAVEPDAAHAIPLVIAMVEAEILFLDMRQRHCLLGERRAQSAGHLKLVVLPGLRPAIEDAAPLAGIGHVRGDRRQEFRIADLQHCAAGVAHDVSVQHMRARLALRDSAVHAEQTEQRLKLRGELVALHRDADRASLGAHVSVGVDQAGQERDEKPLRLNRDPARYAQRGGLYTRLAVDQVRRGAARRKARDAVVPDRRAIRCRRGHDARTCTGEAGHERGVTRDHFPFRGADLEDEAATVGLRTRRPHRTRRLVNVALFMGAAISEMRTREPPLEPSLGIRHPIMPVVHERVRFVHLVSPHVHEPVIPMHEHRMLDGRSEGNAIGDDADVFLARHVRREVLQDWPHFERASIPVVAQDLAMLLSNGFIRRDEAVLGANPSARSNATGLQREASLMDLVEDVVHRIADGSRHRAIDGRGGGLVLQRAGVRGHAACGNRPTAQRPGEALVPLLTHRLVFDVRQRACDALVGVVHRLVDGRAVFGGQAIFLVPDVERRLLERNGIDVFVLEFDHAIHGWDLFPVVPDPLFRRAFAKRP